LGIGVSDISEAQEKAGVILGTPTPGGGSPAYGAA
jgi:hypothetical protein